MIATDKLFRIIDKLWYPDTDENAQCINMLRSALHAIVNSDVYLRWIDASEFEGIPCPIPTKEVGDALENLELLSDSGELEVKVNRHQDSLLLTDGLWTDPGIRVFPFTDESALLLKYVEARGYDRWADVVIDPATGSGNHMVGIDGNSYRLALDINPRAIAYAVINGLINQIPHFDVGYNDIRNGYPYHLQFLRGNLLFIVNMPFALSPPPPSGPNQKRYLPLHADGGLTGAEKTFSALTALERFWKQDRQYSTCRAVVLCYSVGNINDDCWQVVERARTLFGPDRVKWQIQFEEKMWRVNGVKSEPNPMNLAESLPKKADCRFYVQNKNREEVRAGYYRLVDQLKADGWDHLGYGILDIDLA